EHIPEGRTREVSALRGHSPRQALKCIVTFVRIDNDTRHLLLVVRGDQTVDFAAIKSLYRAKYAGFAQRSKAVELTGCEIGCILPVSFHEDLHVIADESLRFDRGLIYFNAGALDKSLAIAADDYLKVAQPKVALISKRPESQQF